MSRHTLNDGQTPDKTLSADLYDRWLPILGPPAKLLGDYYKRGLPWAEFETGFNDYLSTDQVSLVVSDIALDALERNITLMCIEETPEQCHRRLVAERCKLIVPELVTVVL